MDDLGQEVLAKQEATRLSRPMRYVTRVSQAGVAISAISLFFMMFVSLSDVVGRNIFRSPVEGASEIVGMLLVVTASLGLGWCQLLKGNVRIDLIYNRLRPRGKAILDVMSNTTSIAIAFIIFWQGLVMMSDYVGRKLGATTADLNIQIWPFYFIMALGFGWATFIFLLDLIESIKRVARE